MYLSAQPPQVVDAGSGEEMYSFTRFARYHSAMWVESWNGFSSRMRLAGLRRARAGSRGFGVGGEKGKGERVMGGRVLRSDNKIEELNIMSLKYIGN